MVEAQGRRILLIHDDAAKLAILQQALQHAQFQVNAAPSSPAAIRDLRQVQPDVVICRNRMPMLGGRHVIRAVGAVDADIPVVITSEESDLITLVDLMRAGAFDCVIDPTHEIETLVHAAERAVALAAKRLRSRQLEQELQKAQVRMSRMLEQEAVIRERAFLKVEEPLERAIKNLTALTQAPLGEPILVSLRGILADVWDVSERLQSAQTDAGRTSTRSVALEDFHPLAIAEFFRDATLKAAHARGSDVAYVVPAEIPALRGDPGQLRSVLVDLGTFLLERALDGETLFLELRVVERGPGHWLIAFELSNTGSTDRVEGSNVIERYLPGDDAANVREDLIDLSRAARAVSLLGGELEMFESAGRARLAFELGLLESKRRDSDLVDPGLVPSTVLVADPVPAVARCIATELSKLGMHVEVAGSGSDAVARLRAAGEKGRLPALVFVSLSLPEREQVEAHLNALVGRVRPERVYLARAGEVAPSEDDALLLMRPPRRSVLVEVLKRTVGAA